MFFRDYVSAKERLTLPAYKGNTRLILKRSAGQSIWICKDIQIIVLGHFNGITRIGIEAPPEIKILREEVRNREQRHERK